MYHASALSNDNMGGEVKKLPLYERCVSKVAGQRLKNVAFPQKCWRIRCNGFIAVIFY